MLGHGAGIGCMGSTDNFSLVTWSNAAIIAQCSESYFCPSVMRLFHTADTKTCLVRVGDVKEASHAV